mgnify:CR=1 FL=1
MCKTCNEGSYVLRALLQDYKEWLEEQLPTPDKKDPWISDFRDSSSHEDIKFVIKLSAGILSN